LPSQLVAAASRSWHTMPASALRAPRADRSVALAPPLLQRPVPQGAGLFCCCGDPGPRIRRV